MTKPKPKRPLTAPTVWPGQTPQPPVQRINAPTHDPRYACAPGERPYGAGFAAVGVGRDVETGKAWAA